MVIGGRIVRTSAATTVAAARGRRPPPAAPLLAALVCLAAFAAESVCRGQGPAGPAALVDASAAPGEPSPPPGLPGAASGMPPVVTPGPLPDEAAFPGRGPAAAPTPSPGDEMVLETLPFGVLWEPPIANQREPRCYVKFTSLRGEGTIDTGIGAVFALGRIGPASRKHEGFEIDVLAAVFTRFGQDHTLACSDYRVGCPLTFAKHDWQFKLGYEHTSTHTGDDFLGHWITDGMFYGVPCPAVKTVRDEIVLGIARRFRDRIRLYGQFGYNFDHIREPPNSKWRYDWGVERTPPRNSERQDGPYAAFDMDLREEQNFFPNVTVQAGWQWRVRRGRSSAGRLGAEYYNGKSPFGRFVGEPEHWWGFVASYDW